MLGGTQSLHTNSMDETLALPTEEAVQLALRTQQILAYETGVPNVVDPLGGSYYVEALTDAHGGGGRGLLRQIDDMGGVVPGDRERVLPARDRRGRGRYQEEIEQAPRDRRRQRVRRAGREARISILRIDEALRA